LFLAPAGLSGRAFGTNVRLQVKPDCRDKFMASIQACQKATLEEPLAVEYVFGEEEGSPNTFLLHEHYDGKKGFEEHVKTAHCKDWESFLESGALSEPPEKHPFLVRRLPNSEWSRTISWEPRFCVNSKVHVKPDMREKFLECVEQFQINTLEKEMMSLDFLVGEDENEADTFCIHEQYIGKDGFEAHEKESHFAPWSEFLAEDPFTEPPKVERFLDASFTPDA